jgi:tRNA pseudouridine38-40 synthase
VSIYRLLIEYDGRELHGWQVQPGLPTVQGNLEDALSILLRRRVAVVGAGRTDAGVHARGQVAHFVCDQRLDTHRLRRSLNGILPRSIRVLNSARAPDDFHARYSAVRRLYRYFVATEPRSLDAHARVYVRPAPDFVQMNRAADHLRGRHDFTSFCKATSETQNRVCVVTRLGWIEEARPGDWFFEIEADRFLHGMVRTVVGTLLQVGRSTREPSEVAEILASRDRRMAGPTAPPGGLVLERVTY